jgi:hypothetical protein
VGVGRERELMTYEDLKALTPDQQLHILLPEDGLEGVYGGAHEELERGRRNVEERGNDAILKLERSFVFHGSGVLAEVDDVSVAGRAVGRHRLKVIGIRDLAGIAAAAEIALHGTGGKVDIHGGGLSVVRHIGCMFRIGLVSLCCEIEEVVEVKRREV